MQATLRLMFCNTISKERCKMKESYSNAKVHLYVTRFVTSFVLFVTITED